MVSGGPTRYMSNVSVEEIYKFDLGYGYEMVMEHSCRSLEQYRKKNRTTSVILRRVSRSLCSRLCDLLDGSRILVKVTLFTRGDTPLLGMRRGVSVL